MRKFVVSDLYGDREMFSILSSYLDKIDDDVLLILNGNIVREDDYSILEDIQHSNISILYLGGNIEYNLYHNSGCSYFGNLDSYCLLREGIYCRRYMISHGDIPFNESNKIRDCSYDTVCRRRDLFDRNFSTRQYMGSFNYHRYHNHSYFLIKGGVPIHNKDGFYYDNYEHILNIDGGCRNYINGDLEYDHVPLVELRDGFVIVRVVNHKGEVLNQYRIGERENDTCKVLKKSM